MTWPDYVIGLALCGLMLVIAKLGEKLQEQISALKARLDTLESLLKNRD